MTLHLHDTATRETSALRPVRDGEVSLYACGPTTQGAPHLGHLRTFLAVDVLVRWLRRSGYAVTYIRNVTDIDDKVLARAAEAQQPWWAWSLRFEREFGDVLDALGAQRPTYEPRATGHVPEMIAFIQRLIERGHAYAAEDGSVYFDVASFAQYGELTRQSLEAMREAAEADDAAGGKRDVRDFALWKRAKDTEPDTASWDTPWGRGRPGWHLECSAMALKYLGETFDIHAGGLDLRFPHHENEQAQSRAAGYGFAQRWLHTGVLTVDGLKMGKSLHNFVTAQDALDVAPAAAVRLALVGGHYRAVVEYNAATIAEAEVVWERFVQTVHRAVTLVGDAGAAEVDPVPLPADFTAAMDDDLAVPEALAVIHRTQAQLNTAVAADDAAAAAPLLAAMRAMLDVLGLDPLAQPWAAGAGGAEEVEHAALDALVQARLAERAQARADRDWARADAIRDDLARAGIQVADGRGGATWNIDTTTGGN